MNAKILIIEDNPANLELMGYVLQAFGHSLRTACTGEEGLALATTETFDLIICDIHLPGIDGAEVARRLKADAGLRQIPLVAVTALAMVGDQEKILAAGFDSYISKPIDPENFTAQIEVLLKTKSQPLHVPQSHFVSTIESEREVQRRTILVVDNLAVHLDLARSILEPMGFCVLTAVTIKDALSLARNQRCDLILSDVCMTGETGFEFIQKVKADPKLRNIPFIFVTSTNTNEKARSRGLELGADKFLFRPIEPESLLTEINDCLNEAEAIPWQ